WAKDIFFCSLEAGRRSVYPRFWRPRPSLDSRPAKAGRAERNAQNYRLQNEDRQRNMDSDTCVNRKQFSSARRQAPGDAKKGSVSSQGRGLSVSSSSYKSKHHLSSDSRTLSTQLITKL